MIETPEVVDLPEQTIARIHLKVPTKEIMQHMDAAIMELSDTLKAQGAQVTGPWFTHHFRRPGDVFDFEVCFPVASAIKEQGRVHPGVWPAMKVARTIYRGAYNGLAEAWGEFDRWIIKQRHETTGELWERYVIGPESGMKPEGWRTELNHPLV